MSNSALILQTADGDPVVSAQRAGQLGAKLSQDYRGHNDLFLFWGQIPAHAQFCYQTKMTLSGCFCPFV